MALTRSRVRSRQLHQLQQQLSRTPNPLKAPECPRSRGAPSPSWYIVSTIDGAIAPDEECFFPKRMKATTTEFNTSHLPMLSKPESVAAVIMEAAAKALHWDRLHTHTRPGHKRPGLN